MKQIVFLCAAFFGWASNATAQTVGDVSKGANLARITCSQCHAVRYGQLRSPNPMAPNFTSIATTLGMTDRVLRVWLQTSHPTMPNIILSQSEKDDVVAYILSLKSAR